MTLYQQVVEKSSAYMKTKVEKRAFRRGEGGERVTSRCRVMRAPTSMMFTARRSTGSTFIPTRRA